MNKYIAVSLLVGCAIGCKAAAPPPTTTKVILGAPSSDSEPLDLTPAENSSLEEAFEGMSGITTGADPHITLVRDHLAPTLGVELAEAKRMHSCDPESYEAHEMSSYMAHGCASKRIELWERQGRIIGVSVLETEFEAEDTSSAQQYFSKVVGSMRALGCEEDHEDRTLFLGTCAQGYTVLVSMFQSGVARQHELRLSVVTQSSAGTLFQLPP